MGIYILYTILVIASIGDFKALKIPNALILLGTVLGISVATFEKGIGGLKFSLLGLVVTLIILFAIWSITTITGFKLIGAGDVKLYAMIGSFLGLSMTFQIVAYSIFFGGLLMMVRVKPTRIIEMVRDLFYLIYYKMPLPSEKTLKKMSFAFPILLTVVCIQMGWVN